MIPIAKKKKSSILHLKGKKSIDEGYIFTPHAQASKSYVIGLSVSMHRCIHVTHYLGNMAHC